jgi:hypothetical protein
MDNIIEPNNSFNFSYISLANPTGIQGGAYFTKIQNNGKALYIQTPKSLTKQGFVKNGKKIYADLMFDNNDEQFIQWIENLEIKCQQLIFEKGDAWFESKLEKSDIETAFSSPMKIYKSGKKYLLRVNVKLNNLNGVPTAKIYNENEVLLGIDDILVDTNLISILEIQGIKFTSRNFQIEIEMKQTMVLNAEILFDNCLINKTKSIVSPIANPIVNPIVKHIVNPINTIPSIPIITEEFSETLEKLSDEILKEENALKNTQYNKDEDEYDEETEDEAEYDEDEDDDYEDNKPSLVFGKELIQPTKSNQNNLVNNGLEELEFSLQELEKMQEPEIELESEPELELKEFNIEENNSITLETMKLKKPDQVYYELYKEAKKRAKESKQLAILAFLEAKNIKKTYMLDNLDESDEEESFSNEIH